MKTPLPRKIFFYTLVCSYILTATFVISLVYGYRFDFIEKIRIHSGSLTVKSNPRDVKIKINGKEPKSRYLNIINDSYQINGLRHGNYDIEVTADGFKSWTKNIAIHSGISTELWNVLLVRKNYERTTFDTQNIDNFFPAPEEFVFAYTNQEGTNLEVKVINTEDNEILNQIILGGNKSTINGIPVIEINKFTDNKYENIEWTPTSSSIIIPVNREFQKVNGYPEMIDNFKDYVIYNLKTDSYFYLSEKILFEKDTESLPKNNASKINIENESRLDISAVRWHPKDKESIYFLSNQKLFLASFDLKDEILSENEEIHSETLTYDFADDGIYILNKEKKLLYDDNFKASKLKEITKYDANTIENPQYRLIAYDKNRIVLLEDKTGDCYLYNKGDKNIYSKKLNTGIVGVHFSNDGKKLAYYSNSEIFVYFTRIWEDQPNREEDETKSITRFSKKIENVHFSKDYEHIIFSSGDEIKIIEMDIRGKSNPQTITSLNTNDTKIISDHRNDVLFFIDKNDYNKNVLYQINFPEENPLF